MKILNFLQKTGPVLVLFVLSPFIAEFLSGSTPSSRAEQLIFEAIFYGPAAILIREITRRRKLGWFSVILLGLAFGIIEEGILLQSAYNPHFLNLNISYGSYLGVNWVWSEIIIVNHSIWSITLPILFTELIFEERKDKTWLKTWGIVLFTVLFLLSSIAFYITFYKMSGFNATEVHFIIAALLSIVLIILANRPLLPIQLNYQFKTPSVITTGIISLLFCFSWQNLLSLVFIKDTIVPAWLTGLTGIILLLSFIFLTLGWINNKWNINYQRALAVGALYSGMFFGLFILIQSGNELDYIIQSCFIVTISVLLLWWRKKTARKINPDKNKI
jgi:hypothetical protein